MSVTSNLIRAPEKMILLVIFLFANGILTVLQHKVFQNGFYVKAFNILHKNDMICIWETFLDSSISPNDKMLDIKRYKLIRAHNPSCPWYASIIKNS